jgi:hypothetical protein
VEVILSIALALALGNSFASFGGSAPAGGGSASAARPATIGWYGDSITAGACSGTAPPAVLDGLLPAGYVVGNNGVSGETTHQIYARAASGAATACVGEACGTYIVQGGVNTLKMTSFSEGYTAAEVASIAINGSGTCDTEDADSCGTLDSVDLLRAQFPTAQILAIGVLPYASCMEPVCNAAALVDADARATAYNAALVLACASRPWLTCINPHDTFESTTPGHIKAEYGCDTDMIHLEQAGSNEYAQQVYDAGDW